MRQAPFLVGERLYLRPLTAQDCDGNYPSWLNDQEVCRYNSHALFPYDREQALEYVERVTQAPSELVLAMVLKEGERHIGNICLEHLDHVHRSAEFAIVIGEKDCWGKGLSKEASRLLLGHAFLALNLHRIYCGVTEDNLPMQRLARSLGMKEEGRRRQALFKHNRYLDVIEYGVLKEEFLVTS